MEPAEQPPRLFGLQEFLQRLPEFRWMGKLLHRSDDAPEQGSHLVAEMNDPGMPEPGSDAQQENGHPPNGNGNGNGGGYVWTEAERRRMVVAAVEEAEARARELEKDEAGSSYGRICEPLLLGPQKYRDPSLHGPNYRLRGAPPGQENSPERIAEMKQVPLSQDKRWLEAEEFVAELNARSNWQPPKD